MDSGLIFPRHRTQARAGTEKGSQGSALDSLLKACRYGSGREENAGVAERWDEWTPKASTSWQAHAPKKSRGLRPRVRCPYRKPTLVGEENILRRLREFWLRNSAIYHRNLGKRWA